MGEGGATDLLLGRRRDHVCHLAAFLRRALVRHLAQVCEFDGRLKNQSKFEQVFEAHST